MAVLHLMEMNISSDPFGVGPFGMDGIMPPPHHHIQLIQQFWLVFY